jgi:outer membrane beta-barrel protein
MANINTGLTDNIIAQLPSSYNSDTAHQLVPSKAMALGHMLKINYLVSADAKITPISGKMGLFGKLFFNYDMYGFAGFGAAGMGASCGDGCNNAIPGDTGNPTAGFRPGGTFGVGMHFFVNNWIAVNAEIRDTLVMDNLAGRPIKWNPVIDGTTGLLTPPKTSSGDVSWDHILVVYIGASFYLPASVDMSK